jgi:short-subunit dehydrogenase
VPSFMWLQPDRVADEAVRSSMRGRPLLVSGIQNRLILAAAKVTPRALLRERTRILHRSQHGKNGAAAVQDGPKPGRKGALITGASAGIGASFAELLARDGNDVVLVARRRARLDERAAELSRKHGVKAHVIVADLAREDAVDAVLAECRSLGWPIDVLVNSAGYPVNDVFAEMTWPAIDAALQILLRSVAQLTHAVLAGMRERGWGRVINVASLAGFEPGSYQSTLYSSAKAAVISFSESVNAELDGTGVIVTALCPGFTNTEWASKANLAPGSVPAALAMESDDVARIGFAAARHGAAVAKVGTIPQRILTAAFQLGPRRAVGWFLSSRRRQMKTESKRADHA